jgi:hypothetical protein
VLQELERNVQGNERFLIPIFNHYDGDFIEPREIGTRGRSGGDLIALAPTLTRGGRLPS